MKFYQVFSTIDSKDKADEMAKVLVQEKLAACIQVTGPVESTYWWEGKVETSKEWLILIKTSGERLNSLIQRLKEIHPYEVPEIIAHEIVSGNPDYLRWIEEVTG